MSVAHDTPDPQAEAAVPGGLVGPYCERCGRERADADHEACAAARRHEPPRYCPGCRRRLVVQVLPAGWQARCAEHGTSAG